MPAKEQWACVSLRRPESMLSSILDVLMVIPATAVRRAPPGFSSVFYQDHIVTHLPGANSQERRGLLAIRLSGTPLRGADRSRGRQRALEGFEAQGAVPLQPSADIFAAGGCIGEGRNRDLGDAISIVGVGQRAEAWGSAADGDALGVLED